ncbi:ankyrin repeat domain-containing protein 13C-like isoform X1 [Schistocerca gregaria]|uniref:ankyrin repeat domain-containing protein 13C-like isoform X1 n=1 Tax=Schistocerca gregaria TaxID=7010 RepID=UPI00211E072F|nr:ankyrin repeat domain-containing protein 13C-like isoform X1 [Schistocerca gregaria]
MAPDFALHRAILENDLDSFYRVLDAREDGTAALNEYDQNGNTPLMLAIHFKRLEMVRELLERDADCAKKAQSGWSPFHEALISGSVEIALMVQRKCSAKKLRDVSERLPGIIEGLRESPNFYTELSWKCSSWIPLVSRFAPSDTYKIWKVGCTLRVDLTLISFNNLKSVRGNRSILFIAPKAVGEKTKIYLLDTDQKRYQDLSDLVNLTCDDDSKILKKIYERRAQKCFVLPQVVTKDCTFELVGKEGDRMETVCGYPCRRYSMKHFCYRLFYRKLKSPVSSSRGGGSDAADRLLDNSVEDSLAMDWEEYKASAKVEKGAVYPLLYKHEVLTQTQKVFRGTVFITQSFPRKITEFLPIFQIILLTSHPYRFKKILNFVQMKLPDNGFPIRFEIPVFPKIQVQVSFLNYRELLPDQVDASLFEVPEGFRPYSSAPPS